MLKSLLKRTVVAVILIGIMFALLYVGSFEPYGFIAFDMMMLIMVSIATLEMFNVMKKKYNPFLIPVIVCILVIYPIQFVLERFTSAKGYAGVMLTAIIGFMISMFIFIFDRKNRSFEDLISTIFVLLYPLLIVSIAYVSNQRLGFLPVLAAIGISLTEDTFAYIFGSLIKGPKIFPNISPKKTWSGCIAGLFGGIAGALLIYAIFEVAQFPTHLIFTVTDYVREMGWAQGWVYGIYIITGFFIGIVSEVGDLAASSIKRRFGVKDYSNLLGAHGGFMDRIDSILFALIFLIPVSILCFGAIS